MELWRSRRGYGYHLVIDHNGIYLMLNGRTYQLVKNAHTGKWRVMVWNNLWRKLGKPPGDCHEETRR
jgi:hypothetical protein